MGKSDTSIAAEFFKLELLLIQTADDAVHCTKAVKDNLGEYDTRHGLHFANTSKSFMRGSIRAAKDAASELGLLADQIAKSKFLSDWEIAAARNKMKAASDAMKELNKAARVYDEMNGKPKGITRIIDNVLVMRFDKRKEDGTLGTADTVGVVVKSTLRSSFGGFSALKHQISVAEKSLSPSLIERVKETVEDVVIKLKETSSSNRSVSL
ncbi:hypothetical protein PF005_g31704 [Phytophthora fragariae]|uniref:Uncharacterized protein n=2 Tax=Phytophthora TaxID=4783 RepID=A0A6A4AYF5_9STRA|nr:hypothetical protein PF003_g9866 [Phytophthora fragariae]KAE8957590.1 hypothetical protein PR002_g31128 [Phytophthora rubi]KAE8917928.1 hypothetical protein PF009_g31755 [Phytophthora fragariae]KAE8957635.1 hypothetical protein PR001_g31303 [Phytophthora rubi]KAE8957724.1 hypothetical protein PF011_g31042 [Phytophthora fragariae]